MIEIKANHRNLILFAGVAFLPCIAFAAKDCRVIEYPDHYEAVCVGDPKYALKQPEQPDYNPATTKGAQVSRKRQRIEEIRALNAHRFDAVEAQSAPDAIEKRK